MTVADEHERRLCQRERARGAFVREHVVPDRVARAAVEELGSRRGPLWLQRVEERPRGVVENGLRPVRRRRRPRRRTRRSESCRGRPGRGSRPGRSQSAPAAATRTRSASGRSRRGRRGTRSRRSCLRRSPPARLRARAGSNGRRRGQRCARGARSCGEALRADPGSRVRWRTSTRSPGARRAAPSRTSSTC